MSALSGDRSSSWTTCLALTPKNDREAQSICKRITPRLSHLTNISEKLSSPFVTLLSSEPEVQYVALRNISLIIQKRPDILKHEMKVYNDPIYYKLEKVDIMIRVAKPTLPKCSLS